MSAPLTAQEYTRVVEEVRRLAGIGCGPVTCSVQVFDLMGIDRTNPDHRPLRDAVRAIVRSEGVR